MTKRAAADVARRAIRWHNQREITVLGVGALTLVLLVRWPKRGWNGVMSTGGTWVLRFGPVLISWRWA